jgi:hypothetical protein
MKINTAADLAQYLTVYVPIFESPKTQGPGIAYHYTCHGSNIRKVDRLFGAAITPGLAQTQFEAGNSQPAPCEDGVVFAYSTLEKTRQEGVGKEIVKITCSSAVSALQTKEAELLIRLNRSTTGFGAFRHLIEPTRLILTHDIRSFEFIE